MALPKFFKKYVFRVRYNASVKSYPHAQEKVISCDQCAGKASDQNMAEVSGVSSVLECPGFASPNNLES